MVKAALKECWELMILDGDPPVKDLGGLAVGDIDNDGKAELFVAGNDGLFWHRPATFEKGKVAEGDFPVGIVLEDLDGDGKLEVVSSSRAEGTRVLWFKPAGDLQKKWLSYEIDPSATAGAHDLVFADVDGDGKKELIALATARKSPGIFAYKSGEDVKAPWSKYTIQTGFFQEGLAAADLDGDGQVEIICGPDWYRCPTGGALSGPWERRIFAPSFREMCRTALMDITGNGRPDIVICESEYMEGKLSWFENRLIEDPENPWVEHPLESGLVYGHTLYAWQGADTGEPHFLVAEMAEGGWKAPRNRDARLIEYSTADRGKTWKRELLYRGSGTHQAVLYDIDGDGVNEIVGKQWRPPKVHIWKKSETPSPLTRFRHRFIDRDKPYRATDILAADIDGDGRQDIVCGAWWYKNPTWKRRTLPGIYQVVNAFDIDGDGREELIATKKKAGAVEPGKALSSELVWLKALDPTDDQWEQHPIGVGTGDWPHGTAIAPILPDNKIALVAGYHSAKKKGHFPEIFEVPDDPTDHPWPKRVLAEIPYGEEFVAFDINGDGKLDLVAGPYWLENLGDGTFKIHQFVKDFKVARVRVFDINADGRPDVLLGEEVLDFKAGVTPRSRLAWFENPGDPGSQWPVHIIDTVRCPHSLDVADLDGDGQLEIVCGEHDPLRPYRSRCRLLIYKMAEPQGRAWFRYVLDDRFEHHDGAKIIELEPGRLGIISHGWKDSFYVHLWEPY